jgi:hypothetical protein
MLPRARGGTRARLALACALSAGLLFSQAQGANVTTMCKVHTHFNAAASIVGSFGNGIHCEGIVVVGSKDIGLIGP